MFADAIFVDLCPHHSGFIMLKSLRDGERQECEFWTEMRAGEVQCVVDDEGKDEDGGKRIAVAVV